MKKWEAGKLFDTGVPALIWRWMAVTARQPAFYNGRLIGGLITGAISILFLHFFSRTLGSSMAGRQAFNTMLYILSLMMGFGGAGATADLLSKEKREGTIGLLLLTSLRPWQLVAGKFILTVLGLVLGMIGQLPMLLIPMLSGGVTLGEGIKAGCSLLALAVFGASLGMAVSGFNTEAKKANGQASGMLSILWFAVPSLLAFIATKAPAKWVFLVSMIFPSTFYTGPGGPMAPIRSDYWTSFAVVLAESFCLLALAAFGLSNTWQQGETRSWWRRLIEKAAMRALGPAEWRAQNRRLLLETNPIAWLTAREWRMNLNGLAVPAGMLGLCFLIDVLLRPMPNIIVVFTALLSVLPGFLLAGRFHSTALTPWVEARGNGVLELLLTTPLNERQIMSGIWTALRKQFTLNIPLVFLIEIAGAFYSYLLMTRINPSLAGWSSELPAGIIWVLCWRWVNLALDLFTLGWTAPWYALSAKTPANQRTGSFPLVIFTPWVVCAAILATWGWLDLPQPNISPLYGLPCLFLGINVIKSVVMIRRARRNFFHNLRSIAAKRYEVTA